MGIQTQKEEAKCSLKTLTATPEIPSRFLSTDINSMMLSMDKETYATRPNYNPHEYRWGDRAARLVDFHLFANNVDFPSSIQSGTPITITATIQFDKTIINPIFGFTLKTKEGITLYGTNSHILDNETFATLGQINTVAIIQMRFIALLTGGDYFISLGISSRHGEDIVPHARSSL
jgi:lipopolysaccharide transport system ATP-binding protein